MKNARSLYILLFLLIIYAFDLKGQTRKIDSLELLLSRHPKADTIKVNLLNELAAELYNRDASRVAGLIDEALQIAQQISYHKGRADSYWIKGLLQLRNNKEEALTYYQKALKIAEVIGYEKGTCNYTMSIGSLKMLQGDMQGSNQAYIDALSLANHINDLQLVMKCRINLARNRMNEGKYLEAAKDLYQVINNALETKDTLLLARSYGNLATLNMRQGSLSTALEYYLTALNYNEKTADRTGCVLNLVNISNIKLKFKEYNEALVLIDKALDLAVQNKDSMRISLCYSFMGNIQQHIDKQQALLSYEKSNEIAQRYGVTRDINNFVQIGLIYCSLGEYDKAKQYLYNALELAENSQLKSTISNVYIKLSSYYLQKKEYGQALDYVQQSLQIAREIGTPILQMDGYDVLTNIYVEKKDYKNAYMTYLAHTQIKDSLYSVKNLQKLALIESEYTFSKEREQMHQKKAEIQQHVEYQQRLIWALVLIFILIVILVVILFRWGQLKRRMLAMELENKDKELDTNRKDIAVAQLKLVQNSERDAHTVKVLEGIANAAQGVDKYSLKSLIGDYKLDGAYTNWEEFEALFNQVNTSFGQNLNRLYPNLTPNERRLCIFMKLNMSNKEISQITFQSEDALKKSRMRLRRKLGIERSVNLAAFIQSL